MSEPPEELMQPGFSGSLVEAQLPTAGGTPRAAVGPAAADPGAFFLGEPLSPSPAAAARAGSGSAAAFGGGRVGGGGGAAPASARELLHELECGEDLLLPTEAAEKDPALYLGGASPGPWLRSPLAPFPSTPPSGALSSPRWQAPLAYPAFPGGQAVLLQPHAALAPHAAGQQPLQAGGGVLQGYVLQPRYQQAQQAAGGYAPVWQQQQAAPVWQAAPGSGGGGGTPQLQVAPPPVALFLSLPAAGAPQQEQLPEASAQPPSPLVHMGPIPVPTAEPAGPLPIPTAAAVLASLPAGRAIGGSASDSSGRASPAPSRSTSSQSAGQGVHGGGGGGGGVARISSLPNLHTTSGSSAHDGRGRRASRPPSRSGRPASRGGGSASASLTRRHSHSDLEEGGAVAVATDFERAALPHLAYLTPPDKRKGKGGRQAAPDPRLDPTIDPRRAARIMANRLAAARSKAKHKNQAQAERQRVQLLRVRRDELAAEVDAAAAAVEQEEDERGELSRQVLAAEQEVRSMRLDQQQRALFGAGGGWRGV